MSHVSHDCCCDAAEKRDLSKVFVLTLDVGGSAVKYGVCDGLGNLTHKGQMPTPNEKDSTVDDLLDVFEQISQKIKDEGVNFEGIAISLPGCVGPNGFMRTGGALLYNYEQPLADLVEKRMGMRPVLENDGKAAAAAELWIGALEGVQSGAVLILGTGLGGGFIIDGKVYQGPQGSAGELSAFTLDCTRFDGERTVGGSLVSATGLVLSACDALGLEYEYGFGNAGRKLPLDGKQVFEMYHEGNEVVKQVIEDFGYNTGKLIFNLHVILDLQKVAIGGGISAQDCLIDAIVRGTQKAWENHGIAKMPGNLFVKPEVVVCQFRNDANLIGAMHQYLEAHDLL